MARGELYACIGMSEPGAGSDLASVRTQGVRTPEGWRISGQKVWTTNAHNAHLMIALVRTEEGSERQEGLTQFLIDLSLPGVTVRPILDLVGGHDFNEVFLDDVLVPDEMRVGEEGAGWKQVTAELSLERSGPERYLSSFALFLELVRRAGPEPDAPTAALIGAADGRALDAAADVDVHRRQAGGRRGPVAGGGHRQGPRQQLRAGDAARGPGRGGRTST